MKRGKFDSVVSMSRLRCIQVLMGLLVLYFVFNSFEVPLVLKNGTRLSKVDNVDDFVQKADETVHLKGSSHRLPAGRRINGLSKVSGFIFNESAFDNFSQTNFSELHKMARHAFEVGKKVWGVIEAGEAQNSLKIGQNRTESCPHSIEISGDEFMESGRLMVIPCGLTLGSHITVVGKPHWAHLERDSKISLMKDEDESVMVSQFMMELQGLKAVDGEDPPKILHFNPRLKGDWSGRPVIEQNSFYRMQWGSALRCEGWQSDADEETVDGQVKCEKWIHDDNNQTEESEASSSKRLIGWTRKVTVSWPYPFVEGKVFVLTLRAGLEGYHVNVDGRHVTSFPYSTGFTLEDVTGLSIKGGVDVQSVYAGSLPSSHPTYASKMHLEMSTKWQAPPLPDESVELFIGILSAGNHFAERMAVRKSWMQHSSIKSLKAVARFLVALHGRKEVNVDLMREAEFFGDMIILSYMDHYDLVVLKTIAICEYGVRCVAAKYILKCDDDTFVRIDAVISEARKFGSSRSLYAGNINYHHRPLRNGKWAVTYEEWPGEHYPPYANGPGYIVSSDIAEYVASEFEKHKLKLFKMEDVSMGMWVEQFIGLRPVDYLHSVKFCQFGCIDDYYTAHYQSPRQMICLWEKLKEGRAQCCNMR